MKEAGEWTMDCGSVPVDFQGLPGSPCMFQGFPAGRDTDQGNGNMENETCEVGAKGEEGGKGTDEEGSGYDKLSMMVRQVEVFRVLRAGRAKNGKVTEILKACRPVISYVSFL